jgi:hypothetical protein
MTCRSSCPRCDGRTYQDADRDRVCVTCGYRSYATPPIAAIPPRPPPKRVRKPPPDKVQCDYPHVIARRTTIVERRCRRWISLPRRQCVSHDMGVLAGAKRGAAP